MNFRILLLFGFGVLGVVFFEPSVSDLGVSGPGAENVSEVRERNLTLSPGSFEQNELLVREAKAFEATVASTPERHPTSIGEWRDPEDPSSVAKLITPLYVGENLLVEDGEFYIGQVKGEIKWVGEILDPEEILSVSTQQKLTIGDGISRPID